MSGGGRKRTRQQWSERKLEAAQHLLPGPRSTDDLARWPSEVMQSLTSSCENDAEVLLRLRTHFTRGVSLYTDYSGIDCPREALRLGLQAVSQQHGWELPPSPVLFARSCDKDSLAQQVLCNLAEGSGGCVFADLKDRLPRVAQDWIAEALPSSQAGIEDQRAAYACIRNWIAENREWLFPDDATSWCLTHKRMCPAHPLLPQPACAGEAARTNDRRLMVNCAGVSCLPWTAEGSQKRDASDCEVAHAIWLQERAVRAQRLQEDIAFVECTPHYPIERVFKAPLSDTHACVWLKSGPELFGWPHRRMRVLGAALNRASILWLGPDSPAKIQEDFAQRFHRAVATSGDLFCVAPPEDVQREYCLLAKKHGQFLDHQSVQTLSKAELLRAMLPPGGVQRFHEWVQAGREQSLQSLGGTFLFDADHHPTLRGLLVVVTSRFA